MKVSVIYLGQFPPKEGKYSGGDRRIEALTSGLNTANGNTELIIPNQNYNPKEAANFSKFKITPLGNKHNRSFLKSRLSFWLDLIKYVRKNKREVVMYYGPALDSIFSIFIFKILNIKLVLEVCDLMSSSNKGFRRTYFKISERIIPKFMNLNISISNHLDEMLKKTAPKVPILRIPVLVDPEEFNLEKIDSTAFMNKYKIDEKDAIIFYMGGIWKNEGIDTLINAYKVYNERYPEQNTKLIIAGKLDKNNPDFVDVESFIENNDLQKKIICLGFVDSNTIKQALKVAKIVTLTQTESVFNSAGLPTKSAEYAMAGKAILATKVGDIPKYFSHLQSVYYVTDENDIVSALEVLLNDDQLRQILGENAKKIALNEFDYKINGKTINTILLNEKKTELSS